MLRSNVHAIHRAREAFITNENSRKIRRGLSLNIRTSGDIKYIIGDSVYYKHMDSTEWHEPAKVLGQDSQLVVIKNGSTSTRVNHCPPCQPNSLIKIAKTTKKH